MLAGSARVAFPMNAVMLFASHTAATVKPPKAAIPDALGTKFAPGLLAALIHATVSALEPQDGAEGCTALAKAGDVVRCIAGHEEWLLPLPVIVLAFWQV